jgi:peptidoglycan/xylan/chitin deacetylase (PgdA/CDA1 family)
VVRGIACVYACVFGAACAALSLSACESAPILLYHSVGERFDPPRTVSVERFRAEMEYLQQENYTILSAHDFDVIEDGKAPQPKKPIVLTFDDGYENFYIYAFPILRELHISASMFIITARTGDDEATRVVKPTRQLIWPEVLEMEAAGIDIESHSVTHQSLKHLSRDVVEREAVDSKAALEAHLGRSVTVFAYPKGAEDASARSVIEGAGYRSALSVNTGLDSVFDRQRISIHEGDDMKAFAHKIGGTWWGKASDERP